MHVFSIWTATKAWSFTSKQYDMTVWTGMLVTTIYMAPCRLRCCNGTDKPGVNVGFSMMSSTQRWHEYRAMFVSYRYTYLFAFTTLLNHSYDDVDRDSCRTNAQWADVEKHRYGVQHIKGCPSDRNERRQLRPSNRFWSQNVHVPHFFWVVQAKQGGTRKWCETGHWGQSGAIKKLTAIVIVENIAWHCTGIARVHNNLIGTEIVTTTRTDFLHVML